MTDTIYLDHNATTPLLPEVADVLREASLRYGANPASQHKPGREARRALENARQRVGELLGAEVGSSEPDRVIFTSGGTEANNLALFGLVGGRQARPGRLIISAVEHPSITGVAEYLSSLGWQVDRLAPDAAGVVQVEQLLELLPSQESSAGIRLVSLMLGNNETGVLQPVAQLAAICGERGIPLHTDACQVVGKLPVDFRKLGVTSLSLAAHKFQGPLGIGALLLKQGYALQGDLFGGFQQAGSRPGTEMVALAVALCRALELWHQRQEEHIEQIRILRDRFEQTICQQYPEAMVVAADSPRLPNTSNIAFLGLDRQALVMALDQAGVACATGSACASGSSEPSPVLVAMGLSKELATGSVRFSLGCTTTAEEIEQGCDRILAVCHRLRRLPIG